MSGIGERRGTPTSNVTVAVLQLAPVPGEVEANVDRLVQAIEEHGPTADLIVAPELATTGYDLAMLGERGHEFAETTDGPTAKRLREAAARAGTTVAAGFLERARDKIYDSLLTVTPAGWVSVYRKSHLYPPEVATFARGDVLDVVVTPAGVLGPLVCFDHAFPEVATTLALAGAQILVIPSAVPLGYEHLLELRTRARAQDNQIFAIGCNAADYGFCGRSLVIGPRGGVLTQAGEEETVLHAELDLAAVPREREDEPTLRLRRPELYSARGDEG